MPNREFHFCAISKITLQHEQGAPTSVLKASDLRLEVSGNLDRSVYLDGKSLPRKDAMKPISNALGMGIITNIRMGAAKGWWKEHEHMQYVVDQLQRAFVAQAGEPHESTMEY